MSNIKSIKERMDREQAIAILEAMKAGLIHNTHEAITKAAAIQFAIESLRGNWNDVKDDARPEQHTHIVIWDDSIKAIGEAYWDGVDFRWVCDDTIACATHWKEYELPISANK